MKLILLLSLVLLMIPNVNALGIDDIGLTPSDIVNDIDYSVNVYCVNDDLLQKEMILYFNTTLKTISENVTCSYGCDNITKECYDYPNQETYYHGIGWVFLCLSLLLITITATGKIGDTSDNHEW